MTVAATHFLRSTYREALLEHLLVGELMRAMWLNGGPPLEVAKPQVDAAGYDLILQVGGVMRHVQLKTSHHEARARSVPIQASLLDRQGPCVVWTIFQARDLQVVSYLWFGSAPGESPPDISGLRTAKHTQADSSGRKAERPAMRLLPRSRFERIDDVEGLLDRLFGPAWRGEA